MKKYLTLIVLIFFFMLFDNSPLYSSGTNNEKEKCYTLYTNTCDNLNFLTIKFLLKNKEVNLNKFKYKAGVKVDTNYKAKDKKLHISGIKPQNEKNGILLSWLKTNKIDNLYKLCENIEKNKISIRNTYYKNKNIICTTKNKKKFDKNVSKLIEFIIDTVKNGKYTYGLEEETIKDLKVELNKYKSVVIDHHFNNNNNNNKKQIKPKKTKNKTGNNNNNNKHLINFQDSLAKICVLIKNNEKKIDSLKKETDRNYITLNHINTRIAKIETKFNKIINSPVIYYLSLGLVFLSFLFWIIFFISNYRKSKKHQPHDDTVDYLNKTTFPHYNKAIDEINNRIKFVVNELDSMKKNLDLYNVRMETLKQAMEKSAETPKSYTEKQEETTHAPTPVSVTTNRYYLPFPDKQGFFWDDKKSELPVSSSIYILELEHKNSTRGTFTLDLKNEKNIKTALTNPASFLKPVCESINNNFFGKRIEIISDGILQLRDDRWSVDGGRKITVKIS